MELPRRKKPQLFESRPNVSLPISMNTEPTVNPATATCSSRLSWRTTVKPLAKFEIGYQCNLQLFVSAASVTLKPKLPVHRSNPNVVTVKRYLGGATTPRRTILPPVDGIASLNGPADLIDDLLLFLFCLSATKAEYVGISYALRDNPYHRNLT
jgi:hypothetical protein